MKKLSLVMAAAMCLTVGGVYATWSYATNDISGTAKTESYAKLAGLGTASEKGSITVKTADVSILIDQDTSAAVSHTAKLTITNNAVVTFSPAVGASVSSINMTIKISESYGTYTKLDGITVVDVFSIVKGDGASVSDPADSYTFTVDSSRDDDEQTAGQQIIIDLRNYIILNNNLVLEDLEEYNAFNTWLGEQSHSFLIEVTETAQTSAA